jgi:hypothetical protein
MFSGRYATRLVTYLLLPRVACVVIPSLGGGGGLSSRPPLIVADPCTAMARTVGLKSRRVIGFISR